MAKNDIAWTRSPSRINLKIIFLQNYPFFMNYAKGPVKIHLLEAEKKTFDPWSTKRVASLRTKLQRTKEEARADAVIQMHHHHSKGAWGAKGQKGLLGVRVSGCQELIARSSSTLQKVQRFLYNLDLSIAHMMISFNWTPKIDTPTENMQ